MMPGLAQILEALKWFFLWGKVRACIFIGVFYMRRLLLAHLKKKKVERWTWVSQSPCAWSLLNFPFHRKKLQLEIAIISLLLHLLNRNTSWLSSRKRNVWILTCTQATQVLSLKLYLKKTIQGLNIYFQMLFWF